MQKRVKMEERMSGVVIWPVIDARWWRVSRRSWAMRSPGRFVLRPSMTRDMACEAQVRACTWRSLVMMMSSLPVL